MICPVCLGSGKRFELMCGWCTGLGFERTLTKEEMIEFIKKECDKNGIAVYIDPSHNVFCNGMECSAFFCSKTKVVMVARNSVNFFENLVHEFCHVRQFLWGAKNWTKGYINGHDACDIVDDFVNNTQIYKVDEHKEAFNRIIELEWECENMTMEYLRHIEGYSKDKINAYKIGAYVYMRFYRAVEYFGKWHLPNKSFTSEGIHSRYASEMKILPNYNDPITPEEIEIVKGCFI